jgi:hypothetical protein
MIMEKLKRSSFMGWALRLSASCFSTLCFSIPLWAQSLCQVTVTQTTNTFQVSQKIHRPKAASESQCKLAAARYNQNPDPQNIAKIEVTYSWSKQGSPSGSSETASK